MSIVCARDYEHNTRLYASSLRVPQAFSLAWFFAELLSKYNNFTKVLPIRVHYHRISIRLYTSYRKRPVFLLPVSPNDQ